MKFPTSGEEAPSYIYRDIGEILLAAGFPDSTPLLPSQLQYENDGIS